MDSTEETKFKTRECQRKASQKYYQKMKDDPAFKAKRNSNTNNWIMKHRDQHNVTALYSYYTRRLVEISKYLEVNSAPGESIILD